MMDARIKSGHDKARRHRLRIADMSRGAG